MGKMLFHEALAAEMARANAMSIHDLKGLVSEPEDVVRGWLDGSVIPTRAAYGRLCVSLRRMRHFRPTSFAEASRSAAVRAAPMPVIAPRGPSTFGTHLREAREGEALSQSDLGAIVGDVTGQAIAQWESDRAAPVRAHYDSLLDLFPILRMAPEPDWRDIDKPSGGKGVARKEGEGVSESRLSLTPPCACQERPSVDVRRIFDAFSEVRGGDRSRWVLEVRVDDSLIKASMRTDGGVPPRLTSNVEGADFSQVCAALISDLEGELEQRIAALQLLRGKIRA